MARENEVRLIGRVKSIVRDNTNKIAQIDLIVVRRNGNRIDTPSLLFFKEQFDLVKDIKEGDFIVTKGFIATMNKQHKVICSNCGKTLADFSRTFSSIICIYAKKIEGDYSLDDFAEVSNYVALLGPVCSNVRLRELPSGTKNAQYRLAISRKIKIDEQSSIITDYPFITSFERQAEEDYKRMEEGSTCWINGGIQTRVITKEYDCDCGFHITDSQKVTEVCPYNVEYLFNCRFDEDE